MSTMNTLTGDRYRVADKVVWRVGYGAMRLAGDGVFGPPRDRDEAVVVLRAAVDAGIDHIDTAQYYGPGVVNQLIREALYPYRDELALVSKVTARRDSFGAVLPYDDPDQLRAGIEENLATLGVEQLTAVNLRVLDTHVPDERFIDQLGALVAARDDGLIAGIGISNVTPRQLLRAREVTNIVCVQNAYNLADRSSDPVLNECMARNIAFVPFCPLGLAEETSRCHSHESGRHRHRRRSRRYTGPGRDRVAAGHRRQRSADPRDQQSRAPRRKSCRWVIVVAGRRNRQPQWGIQLTVRHRRRRRPKSLTALRNAARAGPTDDS
jgi:pyridoxine 4-dehydrogenase